MGSGLGLALRHGSVMSGDLSGGDVHAVLRCLWDCRLELRVARSRSLGSRGGAFRPSGRLVRVPSL